MNFYKRHVKTPIVANTSESLENSNGECRDFFLLGVLKLHSQCINPSDKINYGEFWKGLTVVKGFQGVKFF